MQKTIFKISKMDCPSEEQMIRLKLLDLSNIKSLNFDIPNRLLTVYHENDCTTIFQRLDELNFDTTIINNVAETDKEINDNNFNNDQQKTLLWQVLFINLFFFVLEIITGFRSKSMGLVADSMDMLADSIIYGLALFAVGGTMIRKKNIAKSAGYLQLILAILGLFEVIRRYKSLEEIPEFLTMIFISTFALIGNIACLYLLQKSKSKEAHMEASMIFTSNDVIVNLGVIVAGILVLYTRSKFPDLIIGSIVFYLVAKGAYKILKLSN